MATSRRSLLHWLQHGSSADLEATHFSWVPWECIFKRRRNRCTRMAALSTSSFLFTRLSSIAAEKREPKWMCAEQSHNALTSTCAHSRALPSHLYWHPDLELPSLWRTKCEGCGSMFYLKYSLVAKRQRISDTIIMFSVSKWYILGMKES